MKHFTRHTLALAAALTLAATLSAQAAPPSPESDLAQARAKATLAQERVGALDARLFYEVLVGELTAQQGDFASAYALLMDAAKRTNDPNLFARVAGVALAARDGQAALLATQAWRKADPTSRDASRLEFQVLAGMNRLGDTVSPIQATIANSPDVEKPAVILALPVVFARAEDKAQAIRVADEALAPSLNNAATRSAAWVTKGRVRLMAGDKAGAMQAAQKAQEADPSFDAPPILALELMDAGVAEAEPMVTSYLARNKSIPLRLAYAKTLFDDKRLDEAQTQLDLAVKEDPKYADAWLLLGESQLQRKQFSAAENSLREYLKNADQGGPAGGTPRGVNAAALSLADLALRNNRVADARTSLNKFNERDASFGQLLRQAKLLSDVGDQEAGMAVLTRLPETNDDERRDKTLAIAQFLRDTNHADQAYSMLKKLLTTNDRDPNVLYDTALLAEKTGDVEAMEAHLRKIISIDPKNYNAYNALGYSLAERNVRLDEARTLLTQALALSPDSPHIQDSMGWLEFRLGNFEAALRLLQQAYAEFPDAEVAAHLGEVLWASGDKARAEAVWQEGLQADPKNTVLRDTLLRVRGKRP